MNTEYLEIWMNILNKCLLKDILSEQSDIEETKSYFEGIGKDRLEILLITVEAEAEVIQLERFNCFKNEVRKNIKENLGAKAYLKFLYNQLQALKQAAKIYEIKTELAYGISIPDLNRKGEMLDSFEDYFFDIRIALDPPLKKKSRKGESTVELLKDYSDYVCCVLTAVNQTVQFLETQLAIYDFQEAIISTADEADQESKKNLNDSQQKLIWNCNPAIAGYVISELYRLGYIEPPTHNGQVSYAAFGRLCNTIFKTDGKTGNLTTSDYWANVLNDKKRADILGYDNTLKLRLDIPEFKDLK